jgi:hypothetical protein
VGAQLAEVLRKVENPFEYDDFVKKAALWTGLSEAVLREQSRPAPQSARAAKPRSVLPAGPPGAEELLVSVLLADPALVDRLEGRDIVSHLHTEPWATIASDIFAARDSVSGFEPGELLAGLDDALRDRLASRLHADPTYADEAARERVLADCLARFEDSRQQARKRRLLAEMRRLEEAGDDAGAARLLAEWTAAKVAR